MKKRGIGTANGHLGFIGDFTVFRKSNEGHMAISVLSGAFINMDDGKSSVM